MSWKDTAEPFLVRVPAIRGPEGYHSVKDKLKWTLAVVGLYYILTNIGLVGLGEGSSDLASNFRTILAGSQGTILQLGIAPIVTGSIVMQLLQGENLLGLNTDSDPRDQMIAQGLQKVLIALVSMVTGYAFVFLSSTLSPDIQLANQLGLTIFGMQMLLFAQVSIGGILLLYLDELVKKWGVGSGVGLFIIAGVSQRAFGGLFSISEIGGTTGVIPQWGNIALGNVTVGSIFTLDGLLGWLFGPGQIIPVITTALIIYVVVTVELAHVNVPMRHAQMKGVGGGYPIKLLYASVLPMILVRAVQINIQFMGNALNQQFGDSLPAFFGEYAGNEPVGGLMYILNPINRPEDWMWWLGSTSASELEIIARVLMDLGIMTIGGAVFAVFWVRTTNMGPEASAESIQNTSMQIPGFRRNPEITGKLLSRYIPQVTVIGGALVGALAVFANMLGTIGGVDGIGLLLTISILYKIYEEIGDDLAESMGAGYMPFR